jgi:hypothetical protein
MKLLARGVFAALIALGLVIQTTRNARSSLDPDPMSSLATALARLDVRTTPIEDGKVLAGQAAGCAKPAFFTLLRTDGAEDEKLSDLRPGEARLLYIYTGRVSATRDRTATLLRAAWDGALFVVGLSAHRPPSDLVVAAFAPDCPDLLARDWTSLSPGH